MVTRIARRIAFVVLVAAVIFGNGLAGSSAEQDGGGTDGEGEIRIGALLPLSGSLSSYGETSEAALQAAAEELGVELVIKDTATDPDTALEMLEELHEEGLNVVIGPYASSEVAAVADFANENAIILISPLSTAGTLAFEDDNVLRFTPDDQQNGVALAALAWEKGFRTIVPITRDDDGNQGLQIGMKAAFEELGGTVAPLVVYGPDQTEFGETLDELAAKLEAAGSGPSAIYLTAFAEVTDLFTAVVESDHENLKTTPWLGSDSVALSEDLINDATAAEFASNAYYPNPILGLAEDDRELWEPVSDQIAEVIGREPDAFALAAYDALQVAYEAISEVGADADPQVIREQIFETASGHHGLTGPTVLNDAGDRAVGNYDFWAVCADGDGYEWTLVASYTANPEGDGEIALLSDCSE